MNALDDRNWTNQPREIIGSPVIANLQKDIEREGKWTVHIEVRQAKDGFYLTFGDLFMSQTVHAPDGNAAFRVIEAVGKSDKVPAPCRLMENDK